MASSNGAPLMGDGGTHGSVPSRRGRRGRGQRTKCQHPDCGKYGHSTDRCWVAHPELRPNHVLNRGGSREHAVTNHRSRPFRFLDLPAEIQNRIYEEVYGQGHAVTVRTPGDWHIFDEVRVEYRKSLPEFHLASKKIYADSAFARETAFNGHLRCEIYPFHWPMFENPFLDYLRSKVTKMTFFGYSRDTMWGRSFERHRWCGIRDAFPNVKELYVEWALTQYKYKKGSDKVYTKAWRELWQPGAVKAFYDGDKDEDYYIPTKRLKLKHLVELLNGNGRHCKVFVTTTLQWLDSQDKPVFCQEIKYLHRGGVLSRRAHRVPSKSGEAWQA